MSENRINPLTVANKAENERLASIAPAPVPSSSPSWVPPKVAMVLGIVSVIATAVAAFVPPPFGAFVAILGFCSAALSGAALPQLNIAAGKAIVGPAAVGVVGTIGVGAEQLAGTLQQGTWQQALAYAASAVLALLAGKAVPQLRT